MNKEVIRSLMQEEMNTYISLLRGINVSGKNLIKMEILKNMYETLGFVEVVTYLQSGNVIFKTTTSDEKNLQQTIEQAIRDTFNYEVPVFVCSVDRYEKMIQENPLIENSSMDLSFFHITFIEGETTISAYEKITDKKIEGEQIAYSKEAIYLFCPNGYGRTKLNNNLFERQLKVKATTRNWKTATTLLALVKKS